MHSTSNSDGTACTQSLAWCQPNVQTPAETMSFNYCVLWLLAFWAAGAVSWTGAQETRQACRWECSTKRERHHPIKRLSPSAVN